MHNSAEDHSLIPSIHSEKSRVERGDSVCKPKSVLLSFSYVELVGTGGSEPARTVKRKVILDEIEPDLSGLNSRPGF